MSGESIRRILAKGRKCPLPRQATLARPGPETGPRPAHEDRPQFIDMTYDLCQAEARDGGGEPALREFDDFRVGGENKQHGETFIWPKRRQDGAIKRHLRSE